METCTQVGNQFDWSPGIGQIMQNHAETLGGISYLEYRDHMMTFPPNISSNGILLKSDSHF